MVVLYVLDVPEFLPVVESARASGTCEISRSDAGYYRVRSPGEIVLDRKAMGMKPAVWYGLFTGGMNGEIVEFGRDRVRIVDTDKPL